MAKLLKISDSKEKMLFINYCVTVDKTVYEVPSTDSTRTFCFESAGNVIITLSSPPFKLIAVKKLLL